MLIRFNCGSDIVERNNLTLRDFDTVHASSRRCEFHSQVLLARVRRGRTFWRYRELRTAAWRIGYSGYPIQKALGLRDLGYDQTLGTIVSPDGTGLAILSAASEFAELDATAVDSVAGNGASAFRGLLATSESSC
jgi:hypothetical protein